MAREKTPGQRAFEGYGGLTCAYSSLLPTERIRWEGAGLAAQEPERQRAERAEQARETAEGAWHEATGCAGPDDALAETRRLRARIAELEARSALGANDRGGYDQEQHPQNNYYDERADNIEPAADVAKRLAAVHWEAEIECFEEHGVLLTAWDVLGECTKDATFAGVRAVVSALAAMGEEAWPTWEALHEAIFDARQSERIPRLDALYRSCLSPVLGALRARVAELEAANLVVTPCGIAGPNGVRCTLEIVHEHHVGPAMAREPRPDDDPEAVAASFATSTLDK